MTQPELRIDPITGRAVLIAPERAARAGAFFPPAEFPDDAAMCPFCAGREHLTPPTLVQIPEAGAWRVRVVANRFPAVRGELGEAEIVVERPDHQPIVDDWPSVIRAFEARLRAHREAGRYRCAIPFKNHGLGAGASLSHAHSQFIALPEPPAWLAGEIAACEGRCRFCEWIAKELSVSERVVRLTERYVAIVAIAGRFPYETWVLPRRHEASLESVADPTELAGLVAEVLAGLDAALGRPAWNLIVHTGPFSGEPFHWHIEILPRVTGIAGYELGTGMHINPVRPEEAAMKLRESLAGLARQS